MADGEISPEYLEGESLPRYGRIESRVKVEYAEVLSSIKEPNKLPYIPVVYVIPWVPMNELRSRSITARLYITISCLQTQGILKDMRYSQL